MTILADPNAAPFYERMGARFLRNAPSDAIPGRTLPLYEYDLTSGAELMTALAPPATIAFLGLGKMGRPMAARLAGAGFKLRVFDVSQKAVSDFVGAHPGGARHRLGQGRGRRRRRADHHAARRQDRAAGAARGS